MSLSLTLSNEFFTTTAFAYLKKVRQHQYRVYRVAKSFLDNAQDHDGGLQLNIPFDYQAHSNTTALVTGYEPIDMTVQPVNTSAWADWAFAVSPIAFSGVDRSKNTGKAKIIDLVESRVKDTEMRMLKEFETQLLKGNQTSWSDWITLNGSDVSTGILEEVAVGSQANTVHNISKSTYSSLPGFQNQFADISNDFSANGIARLHRLHIALREVTEDPTQLAGFASLLGAENYLTAIQSNERYITQRDGVGTDVMIDGMKYQLSSLMPDDGGTTTNDPWSFMVIDTSAIKLHCLSGLKGKMTEFRDLGGGQDVQCAFIQYGGQIACSDWKTSGLAIDGETY